MSTAISLGMPELPPARLAERRPTRQLQVGEAMDTQNVSASYSNGVLSLLVPVAQAAQPRRIQVQHDQGQQPVGLTGAGAGAPSPDAETDITPAGAGQPQAEAAGQESAGQESEGQESVSAGQ